MNNDTWKAYPRWMEILEEVQYRKAPSLIIAKLITWPDNFDVRLLIHVNTVRNFKVLRDLMNGRKRIVE